MLNVSGGRVNPLCVCDLFVFLQVTDKDYMVLDEWWGPLKDTMPSVLSR